MQSLIDVIEFLEESFIDHEPAENCGRCDDVRKAIKIINEYEEKLRWISIEELNNPTIPFLGKDENGKIELFKVANIYYMKAIGIVEWRNILCR